MNDIKTKGMVKGLRLNTLKANYLKANKRNYWVRKGVHVHYTPNNRSYWVTTLYITEQFNTIKDVKNYIREGKYLLAYFN